MGQSRPTAAMSLKTISLCLLLALLPPSKCDSVQEPVEEGSDPGPVEEGSDPGYLEMLNALEDGGYDKDTFLVDYDYSLEGRIDPVLVADLSLDSGDRDYPLEYHQQEDDDNQVIRDDDPGHDDEPDVTGLNDKDDVTASIDMKDVTDRVYDYDESSEILETIVGADGSLNMKEEDYHYVDSASLEEESKMIQISLDDLHDQSMIFHIILLLGIVLICVVVFFALVTLMVTVLTRRQDAASPAVRSVKIKTDGIIKTYAKIPVEIKNMAPSNIAYKQLYEV